MYRLDITTIVVGVVLVLITLNSKADMSADRVLPSSKLCTVTTLTQMEPKPSTRAAGSPDGIIFII